MKTYRLSIVPEHAPQVRRVVDFSAQHTLEDLHWAIQDHFDLDNDHMYTFYLSGEPWDLASEVCGPGQTARLGPADRARFFALGLEPGRSFLYLFDFGDELWHRVEVQSVSETEEPFETPRLVEAIGEPPPQYCGPDDVEYSPSAADIQPLVPLVQRLHEAMDHGADAIEADPSVASAERLRLYEIAMELAAELDGNSDRFWDLQEAPEHNLDLAATLLDLPPLLAEADLVDQAAELGRTFAFVDPVFLTDRATILAEAGRRELAEAQIEENLRSRGSASWVLRASGEAYEALGEARAEVFYRRALDAASSPGERAGAINQLVDWLRDQGRVEEVEALQAEQRAQRASAMRKAREARSIRRLGSKVGRNDPCPCGSGKKHKKCCLV